MKAFRVARRNSSGMARGIAEVRKASAQNSSRFKLAGVFQDIRRALLLLKAAL